MALDDASVALLNAMEATGVKPIHEMSPGEARALGAALLESYPPGPLVETVTQMAIPTVDGDRIDVRVFTPRNARAIIVYYHGGGWVTGSLDEFDYVARRIATATRSAVVLVGYRLAPEHPYPAAVRDAWQALEYVAANSHDIAGTDAPLIVAGDSAGANLAAVMALRARAAAGPAIAAQVLIYPVTDARFDTPSYIDPANQLIVSRATMQWYWDHYAAAGQDRTHPDASPLRADSLSGLPPAIVVTAEYDVLRDEGEAYAHALVDAGVAVTNRRFEGQMHGFVTLANLPASNHALDYLAEQINGRLEQLEPRTEGVAQ